MMVFIVTVGVQIFLRTFLLSDFLDPKGLAITLSAVMKDIYYITYFQNLCIQRDHDFNQSVAAKIA